MMINTKEDLDNFYKMDDELTKRAQHVASFFEKIDCDFAGAKFESWYLRHDSDYPNEEYVVCCDYDDYCYGAHDYICVSFEPKWLFATDSELRKHVADTLFERERKEKEKREAEAEACRKKQAERNNRLNGMTREELLRELGVPKEIINGTKK